MNNNVNLKYNKKCKNNIVKHIYILKVIDNVPRETYSHLKIKLVKKIIK